jgi:hypothetical protein
MGCVQSLLHTYSLLSEFSLVSFTLEYVTFIVGLAYKARILCLDSL